MKTLNPNSNMLLESTFAVFKYIADVFDSLWFTLKVAFIVGPSADTTTSHLVAHEENNTENVFSAVHEDGWSPGSLTRTVYRNKYTGEIERVGEWHT